MKINSVSVRNFRNLSEQKIKFAPLLNVICGKNAQGKTNLLEAIYFATIGKSPRTHKDIETIGFGKKNASINLVYQRGGVEHSLDIQMGTSEKKTVLVDGNKTIKLSDIVGQFGSVYFSPDELKLVQGSPGFRRRFIDIINCQLEKQYLKDLRTNQKLLNQRNNLLRQKPVNLKNQLSVWDELLAKNSAKIAMARLRFIEKLQQYAKQIHFDLSNGNEELTINYKGICDKENVSEQDFIDAWNTGAQKSLEKDMVLGYSNFGVHCDDFILKFNGLDLRKNGSQGQQRTATLALKLAEMEILKDEYGEYPVLLLDDVLSELDLLRREKLVNYFKNIQCILTCTEFDLGLNCKIFHMENGLITE